MYVWDRGVMVPMRDFGGTGNDVPEAINARGQVIGQAGLPGQNVYTHAFLWSRGVTTDLGSLPGDVSSAAYGINEQMQIVGESDDATGFPHPYLWQNGAMRDLNTLLAPTSPLVLLVATDINDGGAITGLGLQTSTGAIHAFLAIPVADAGGLKGAATSVRVRNQRQVLALLRRMNKLGMLPARYAHGNTAF
jgi:probable HAF family extracellular repeat protein